MSKDKRSEVWHVEDLENWQKIVARTLTKNGYLVTTTGTATEAKRMIPDSVAKFAVAILDGDLGDGKGEQIADLLREKSVAIGIIGLSGGETPWADISLNKGQFEISELVASIAKIIEKNGVNGNY